MKRRMARSMQCILSVVMMWGVIWATFGGGLPVAEEGDMASLPARQSFIVQGQDAARVAALVRSHGGEVVRPLPIIDGVQALLTPAMVEALAGETAVSQLMPDAPVRATDLRMVAGAQTAQPTADFGEVVGADVVWADEGNEKGAGVTVAVVDTGISPYIPGLNFNADGDNREIVAVDFVTTTDTLTDPHGHGTHIAGIVASSRVGDDDNWNGVAPNADLVSVRVLDETGWGTYGSVIAGIQWVVDNKDAHDIQIMNLSLVAAPQSPYWADPLNQAVMAAWDAGLVVVVAAGNGGPDPMTIGVPGNVPYVITVGAFTDNYTPDDWSDDYITPFSAAGPTLDAFVKPDVVAPGAHMVSTMMPDSYLAMEHELYKMQGNHFAMAGTSQATAVVSGISALILADPDNASLTPDQIKYRIMHTALLWMDEETEEPLYSVWQQGAGRVNAPDAVFTDTIEAANYGITLTVDLADPEGGYQGYTYYDPESGYFYLYEMPETWAGGYSTWAGGYSTWAGGYSTWAGGYSTWAGGYSTWAGGYSTWAGGYSTWAGGYSTWAGGYTNWIESLQAGATSMAPATFGDAYPWPDYYNEADFLDAYLAGEGPAPTEPIEWGEWVEEVDWSQRHLYLPLVTGN